MPDYSKGNIYKIYNIDEPAKFYVGSTVSELWHRIGIHKATAKRKKTFFYQEVNRLGWKKFKIELIHNFPCNSRPELLNEEERVRSLTDAYYNTNRAFRTDEEKTQQYETIHPRPQ